MPTAAAAGVVALAATTTAAAAEIAAGTFLSWAGFIYGESASIEFLAVNFSNGLVGLFLRTHLHERKAPGLAREFVHDEFATDDIARLFEQVENLAFRRVERQVAYE